MKDIKMKQVGPRSFVFPISNAVPFRSTGAPYWGTQEAIKEWCEENNISVQFSYRENYRRRYVSFYSDKHAVAFKLAWT